MIRGPGLAFWLLAGAAGAQDLPALHHVTGVAAGDVLNLRERPDATAPVVGTLSPDATGVEVVALDGGWSLVNTSETAGYAASRFLTRDAGPGWNTLQQPLHCLGTEPFWNLAISPQTGTAWLSTPEDPDPEALAIGPLWPALPWSPVAAFAVPDGMVMLSPADCSDGMSDRRYGIAADLFLSRPGSPRYSGCCGLSLP